MIATKFGNVFDETTRTLTGTDVSPGVHPLGLPGLPGAARHRPHRPATSCTWGTCRWSGSTRSSPPWRTWSREGLIRSYGWSTDDPDRAAAFAKGPHCAAVQNQMNLFDDAPGMLAVCETHDLASMNRGPLAMGLLTGKYDAASRLPGDDVRGMNLEWLTYFTDGRPNPELLARLDAVREILTSGGRTLAQGALGWLLARSGRTVPIPGIRTVAQAEENAGTLRHGPLTPGQFAEVETLLRRRSPDTAA